MQMTALVTLRTVIYVCLIPRLYTATRCVRHRSPTSPVITAGTDTSCHTTSLQLVLVAFTPVLNRSGEPRPAVQLFSLHRQSFTVFIPNQLHPLQAFCHHGWNRDHHVTKLWMTENRLLKPSYELRKVALFKFLVPPGVDSSLCDFHGKQVRWVCWRQTNLNLDLRR